MTNRALIHMMADWLENRNFNQNAVSARARTPWYWLMPNRLRAATAGSNTRTGFQYHPNPAKEATASARMPTS
jgi:hypothetical protein